SFSCIDPPGIHHGARRSTRTVRVIGPHALCMRHNSPRFEAFVHETCKLRMTAAPDWMLVQGFPKIERFTTFLI
ncbi:MAG TPA: hypothetical protein VNR40_18660, partial [Steroidobacter sp.]|nr:hypothetical protein [Steroidobacter sp.]